MFIRKKDYKELRGRVDDLDAAVSSLSAALLRKKQTDASVHATLRAELGERIENVESALEKCANANDITDVLFGFATDIEELTGKVAELKDTIEDGNSEYQQERLFLQGLHGINTFTGVKRNGE